MYIYVHAHTIIAYIHRLLMSGHSQGGTRAALVSMYLRRRYGVMYNATTFAATGPQVRVHDCVYVCITCMRVCVYVYTYACVYVCL